MSAGTSPSPSTKQQRAAERERKLAEFRAKEARRKRNGVIITIASIAGVAVLVTGLVLAFVFAPKPATYTAGSAGAEIEGVQTFENESAHVQGAVDYPQTPPAGGAHSPAWLNCGVYTEPVPAENAVHSQEHGAVWVTYDPSLSAEDLAALEQKLPKTYVVLSPYEGLPSPIVLSGWNVQLEVDDANDPRIAQFLEEYWQGGQVPEPGAACTGGVDAPGKVA
ncbi:DUF3105 domain-containing protein [Agromyces protaetiae]|uniref:DUF3105 domain-containing protein n=1 Tax=Agromyces protaetiae TaxID=2509455 RepID=A0A4V0YGR2_9MICO|nr:DUF3105 domain-containing protein [Agromyces protaetiae]QAY72101.1 DUF3105 domain-containing protein [Agromyces protaetiae]